MDKFESLRAFVKVVEYGGFAAAARAMGVSRSVVNKNVIALENELGAQLLQRSTRRVALTETGEAFHQRCVPVLADLDDAIATVAEAGGRPAGNLRINAPMSFGTLRLSALVAEFIKTWPEVHVELVLNDRFIDPIEEGFDLTLRVGEPRDATSLVTRRIAPIGRVLCAASAYLDAAGAPGHPRELRSHRCLHYGYQESGSQWRLAGPPDGEERSYAIRCVMWSNNGEVLRDAAVAATGIALLPTFIVDDALREGRLKTVLDEFAPPPAVLCALYPRHRHLAAKVRAFVDLLVQRLGGARD